MINSDYFGFNFPTKEFFLGNKNWYRRFKLRKPQNFDPNTNGMNDIFSIAHSIARGSINPKEQNGIFNAFIYVSRDFPIFLEKKGLIDAFDRFRTIYNSKYTKNFEIVMHGASRKNSVPLGGDFKKFFQEDINLCNMLGIKNIIVHPPGFEKDTTSKFIDLLCTDEITQKIYNNNINLCIENMTNIDFFGSLKNFLVFKDRLFEKYKEIGLKELIPKIKLCFDTGHLILWRYHHPGGVDAADEEISKFLPEYSKLVKVVHIKTCNAHKNYYVPFSKKGLFLEHSKLIMDWLGIINKNKKEENIFYCLEITTKHQKLEELIEFQPILLNSFNNKN